MLIRCTLYLSKNLKSVQGKCRDWWLAKLKRDIKVQTALTLLGHGSGSGVEVQRAACHGLEGVVDALWNQDDLEEAVDGVRAYRQREVAHRYNTLLLWIHTVYSQRKTFVVIHMSQLSDYTHLPIVIQKWQEKLLNKKGMAQMYGWNKSLLSFCKDP